MDNGMEFLRGKKTDLAVIVAVVLAVLDVTDKWTMPPEGWAILGALGLGFLRADVEKMEVAMKETADKVKDVDWLKDEKK